MKKQDNNVSASSTKKAKRRKVWGIICLSLGGLLLLEGIVLGIVMRDTTLLFVLGPEGLIILAVGILLMRLSKRAASEAAASETKDGGETTGQKESAAPAKAEETVKYKVKEIFDEDTRKVIHEGLDTFSRIYRNLLGDSFALTGRLTESAALFDNPETEVDKSTWLTTATFLSSIAKIDIAASYRDVFVNKGEKAILDFFADK